MALRSTRVDYVLCGNGSHSLSNIEYNKSKCCPALPGVYGALVIFTFVSQPCGHAALDTSHHRHVLTYFVRTDEALSQICHQVRTTTHYYD